MDMSAAYAKGVGLALPAAAISFDRFHVVAMAGEAMNQVRAAEMRRSGGGARGAGRVASRRPTRLVWGMRKNLSGRNTAQTQAMHGLQRSNLKSARAWRLKMALRDVYAQATASNDAAVAGNALRHGLSWARRSRLEPFKKLAATLKDRLPAIVRGMLEHRSNAFVEAMNGLRQQAKRAARGYRTAANFIAVAYLRMSKLKHLPFHRTQPLHVRLPNPFGPLGTVARLR